MFIAVFRQWTGRKGGGEEEGIAGTTLRLIFHSTCFYFLPSGVARKRRGLPRTGSDTRCVRPPPPFFVFSSSKVCPRCAEGRKRDKGRESSINRRRTYTSKAAPLSKLGEISEFRSMAGGGGEERNKGEEKESRGEGMKKKKRKGKKRIEEGKREKIRGGGGRRRKSGATVEDLIDRLLSVRRLNILEKRNAAT